MGVGGNSFLVTVRRFSLKSLSFSRHKLDSADNPSECKGLGKGKEARLLSLVISGRLILDRGLLYSVLPISSYWKTSYSFHIGDLLLNPSNQWRNLKVGAKLQCQEKLILEAVQPTPTRK